MKSFFLAICLLAALTAGAKGQSRPSSTTDTKAERAHQQQMKQILAKVIPPRPTPYGCTDGECSCVGVWDCINMIEANVCPNNGTFTCKPGGEPSCSCLQ